jgi:hypothetical protein
MEKIPMVKKIHGERKSWRKNSWREKTMEKKTMEKKGHGEK